MVLHRLRLVRCILYENMAAVLRKDTADLRDQYAWKDGILVDRQDEMVAMAEEKCTIRAYQ